jgi:homospermidine synthase
LKIRNAGIVEADEMDYKRCLEVQMPYLGPVEGHYTDWTPLDGRPGLFPEDIDEKRPVAVPQYPGALSRRLNPTLPGRFWPEDHISV